MRWLDEEVDTIMKKGTGSRFLNTSIQVQSVHVKPKEFAKYVNKLNSTTKILKNTGAQLAGTLDVGWLRSQHWWRVRVNMRRLWRRWRRTSDGQLRAPLWLLHLHGRRMQIIQILGGRSAAAHCLAKSVAFCVERAARAHARDEESNDEQRARTDAHKYIDRPGHR